MKDLEFINDHRKKRISKDLNKQLNLLTDEVKELKIINNK